MGDTRELTISGKVYASQRGCTGCSGCDLDGNNGAPCGNTPVYGDNVDCEDDEIWTLKEEVMNEFKKGDVVEIVDFNVVCGVSPEKIKNDYFASSLIRKVDWIEAPNFMFPKGRVRLIDDSGDGLYFSTSAVRLVKKKEYIALNDMSIEAFCEATDNRDEVFCKAITHLIEHVVSEDDGQIWIETLDVFRSEHALFWQWLIDEGFIGEKEELKPCPLCGKDVKVYTAEDWYDDSSFCGFNVGCSALNGGCGCSVGHPKSKEGAIEKWNKRA